METFKLVGMSSLTTIIQIMHQREQIINSTTYQPVSLVSN